MADPTVPASLAADPAYLAFQRALDLQKSNAEASTQASIDQVNGQVPSQLAQIADPGAPVSSPVLSAPVMAAPPAQSALPVAPIPAPAAPSAAPKAAAVTKTLTRFNRAS